MNRDSIGKLVTPWSPSADPSSEEVAHRARTLSRVVLVTTGVTSLFLGLAIIVQPETLARRLTSILIVMAVGLVVHALNRAGRTRLGAWIFVIGIFAILFQRSFTSGGISAPQSAGFVISVLFAGVVLGARAGAIVALISWMAGLAMVIAYNLELLPPSALVYTPLVTWLYNGIWLSLALVLQQEVADQHGHKGQGLCA